MTGLFLLLLRQIVDHFYLNLMQERTQMVILITFKYAIKIISETNVKTPIPINKSVIPNKLEVKKAEHWSLSRVSNWQLNMVHDRTRYAKYLTVHKLAGSQTDSLVPHYLGKKSFDHSTSIYVFTVHVLRDLWMEYGLFCSNTMALSHYFIVLVVRRYKWNLYLRRIYPWNFIPAKVSRYAKMEECRFSD